MQYPLMLYLYMLKCSLNFVCLFIYFFHWVSIGQWFVFNWHHWILNCFEVNVDLSKFFGILQTDSKIGIFFSSGFYKLIFNEAILFMFQNFVFTYNLTSLMVLFSIKTWKCTVILTCMPSVWNFDGMNQLQNLAKWMLLLLANTRK